MCKVLMMFFLHICNKWQVSLAETFGHVYAFNKRLVQEAGYEPESLFQAVRDYKWDYDMFLEIARKITKDTDGDGQYDIWGVALDCDGNEIWSNATGPIIQDESTGKWVANLRDPRILKSMEFMKNVSGDPQVQFPLEGEAVPSRGGQTEDMSPLLQPSALPLSDRSDHI
jgi:ABC-type glycerol-3-phosphate transport system substrate-binding protein